MEKYIKRDSIISLELRERTFVTNIYQHYQKPFKLFGIKLSDGYYYYNTSIDSNSTRYYRTAKDYFNRHYGYCGIYELSKNNEIYSKPYIIMLDKNNTKYTKTFNTDNEMKEYVNSLDLDIVKNNIKISFD